jgi:aspartyl-tRNA synthetase
VTTAWSPCTIPSPAVCPTCTCSKPSPGKVRATAYDIVLNGVELGSGSIRIHDSVVQQRMFDLLKVSPEEKEGRFGHLIKRPPSALRPHGGIALGFDRLAMLMAGAQTIRDVIAFPKTTSGIDLMMEAPGAVSDRQLKDVHIQLASTVEIKAASFTNIVK